MSVSDDMIRSYFERWQRLEEEKRTVSDDLKELFAEAKSNGLDGKALRTVFREQVGDKAAAQEFDAICDLYRASLNAPRAGHAREASGSSNGRTPEFDSGNGGSNPSPETITEPTPHSERSHDAARPSASAGNAPGEIPASNFPSTVSTRTVDETAEPAVAQPQAPQIATADQFSRAPVETNPLHEQADVKIPGSNPRETRAGASGEGQRRPPNEVEPGPHSLSPSSEERSSPLKTTAGDAPLSSPATPSEKPGCLKLKDGHCKISFATSALCSVCNAARFAEASA